MLKSSSRHWRLNTLRHGNVGGVSVDIILASANSWWFAVENCSSFLGFSLRGGYRLTMLDRWMAHLNTFEVFARFYSSPDIRDALPKRRPRPIRLVRTSHHFLGCTSASCASYNSQLSGYQVAWSTARAVQSRSWWFDDGDLLYLLWKPRNGIQMTSSLSSRTWPRTTPRLEKSRIIS